MSRHFLYYWRKYINDTSINLIYKLNQSSHTMKDIQAGDIVWAICRPSAGVYCLAARFVVSKTGENPTTSADYKEYGKFYFAADPDESKYFKTDTWNRVEDLVRSLSISPRAELLGQSFQGKSAVRALTQADASILDRFNTRLGAHPLSKSR